MTMSLDLASTWEAKLSVEASLSALAGSSTAFLFFWIALNWTVCEGVSPRDFQKGGSANTSDTDVIITKPPIAMMKRFFISISRSKWIHSKLTDGSWKKFSEGKLNWRAYV